MNDELIRALRDAGLSATAENTISGSGRIGSTSALVQAGLTSGLVREIVGRVPAGLMPREADLLVQLVEMRLPVAVIAGLSRLGCRPSQLENAMHVAGPDTASRRRLAVLLLSAAQAGLVDRADEDVWVCWAAVGFPLAARQAGDLDPVLVGRWLAWTMEQPGSRNFADWVKAAPGEGVARWLDVALSFAAAGYAPAVARRLMRLPEDHPDRPSAQDLAVMAGLRA